MTWEGEQWMGQGTCVYHSVLWWYQGEGMMGPFKAVSDSDVGSLSSAEVRSGE